MDLHAEAAPGETAERVGRVLALALAGPSLTGALAWLAGVPVGTWLLPVAWGIIVVAEWRSCRGRSEWLTVIGAAAVIVVLASVLAGATMDLSYDGQTYHQSGIRRLAASWNPVWSPRAVEGDPSGLHVFSVPKGVWIVQAAWYRLTGCLECAKATNFVAAIAAGLLVFSALVRRGLPVRWARGIAVLVAAAPVTITQLFTFYLDGFVGSMLSCEIALLVLATGERRAFGQRRFAASAVGAFLATAKFTSLVYVVAIAVALLAVAAWRDRAQLRAVAVSVAIGAVLAAAAGVNPYATNAVLHGHPAYPAAGRDAVPLVRTVHRDSAFNARPAAVQLAISLFAVSTDDSYAPPVLKWPATLRGSEIGAFTTVDARLAGWGPFFSAALVLAWIMLGVAAWRGDPAAPMLLAASMAFVASALLVPFGFYARYAPQLWLAPVPALLLRARMTAGRPILAALLAANAAFVLAVSAGAHAVTERAARAQLAALAAARTPLALSYGGSPFTNVDLHLDAYGIAHREARTPACARPSALLATDARVCFDDGRSPPPPPDPLDAVRPLAVRFGIPVGYR